METRSPHCVDEYLYGIEWVLFIFYLQRKLSFDKHERMKRVSKFSLSIGVFLLIHLASFGQKLLVPALPSVIYKDIPLKFELSIPNTSCSELIIKVKNGQISIQNCSIGLKPDSIGSCQIIIQNKKGEQLKPYEFSVIERANYKGFIGNKWGGTITKDRILEMGGLIVRFDHYEDIEIPIKVISYNLQIIRKGNSIASTQNLGARFEETTKAFINKLLPEDLLIVYAITAQT